MIWDHRCHKVVRSWQVVSDRQTIIDPRRPRLGVLDIQQAQPHPLRTVLVTQAKGDRPQRKKADWPTTEGTVTSHSIGSFVPRMTDVRLHVSKFKLQNTLDGSDKRSDEVGRRLRRP